MKEYDKVPNSSLKPVEGLISGESDWELAEDKVKYFAFDGYRLVEGIGPITSIRGWVGITGEPVPDSPVDEDTYTCIRRLHTYHLPIGSKVRFAIGAPQTGMIAESEDYCPVCYAEWISQSFPTKMTHKGEGDPYGF